MNIPDIDHGDKQVAEIVQRENSVVFRYDDGTKHQVSKTVIRGEEGNMGGGA